MSAGRFAKNALSNVVTGTSSAVLAIILPYFFVRYLDGVEFSLWVLVLQLGTYVNYLNFGVQTAIGRYVAFALGRQDETYAKQILGAGIQILTSLGGIGLLVIAGLAWIFPVLFRSVPANLLGSARETLLWIGGALALGLPFTAYLGVFVGLQRNELPAIISGIGRIILGAGLIFSAMTHDLVTVARVYFFLNLGIYIAQYITFRRIKSEWRGSWRQVSPAARRELTFYCVSLTAWSLSMLLINGVSTSLVGIFDFAAVASFGVAITAVNFFVGLINSLLAPLIQIFSKANAASESQKEMKLLNVFSFLSTFFLALCGSYVFVLSGYLMNLWVGATISTAALPLFYVLSVSNIIRNTQTPYALYLIASGQQRRVILTPVLEGVVNFGVGIVAAQYIGAMGVAIGALCGSTMGVVANFFYNFKRTLPENFDPHKYFLFTLLTPLLFSLPVVAVSAASVYLGINLVISFGIMSILAAVTAVVIWRGKTLDGIR